MRHARRTLLALSLLLAGATSAPAVISPSGIDPRLRIQWDVVTTRSGRPQIEGWVLNDYMRAASNVRLLVETLDDKGEVIERSYGFVVGIVPLLNRAPFDVPLKKTGASYRIAITAFDWRDGGGGM